MLASGANLYGTESSSQEAQAALFMQMTAAEMGAVKLEVKAVAGPIPPQRAVENKRLGAQGAQSMQIA
jgi:hypothetical protein